MTLPAVYKRAAWSVNYSDKGARVGYLDWLESVFSSFVIPDLLQPSWSYN